ncbi:hypothetical protein BJ741DRAFT_28512 [Chytriomyces cf. hyalinus JEL632]|nr:hypothetical protein BJ741DRAFT_28512 [Chytriomyces cf. hyalinus JEL632]
MDIGDYKQATEFFIGAPLAHIGVPKYSLLFGWIGGSFKNVEKYAQYYRNNGFTVYIILSYYADMTSAADGTESLTYFDELIEEMSRLKLAAPKSKPATAAETPNAVLHLFSNGGSIKLRHLLHCLDARNMKLKTSAVILDSCPGRASLEGGSHFVTVGIKNSVARVIARNGVYAAYRMYMAINAGFAAVGLPFKDMSKHPIEIAAPYAVSEKNPDGNVTGPRLFLYSDEDKLCQVHEIQERIEACKAEGIVVEEKMFVGSEHVKHAVVHREEYWGLVTAFLERWC